MRVGGDNKERRGLLFSLVFYEGGQVFYHGQNFATLIICIPFSLRQVKIDFKAGVGENVVINNVERAQQMGR